MNDTVIFGLILLGIGVMLIVIGVIMKFNRTNEEHSQEKDITDSPPPQSTQRKYGPDDVLNKMKRDEGFRKEVYNIINRNKENKN